jgi:2-polyprenyl-6-methoxyphenol hydroxylase-like FAD-dependent oxidoreductase
MSTFKVVVVGGSIAGLTLANILERYSINYVVLEKHPTIAPQLGASVGTLPHGARILDQLGIFSRVDEISMPVDESEALGPDAVVLGKTEPFGDLMEDLLVVTPSMLAKNTELTRLEQTWL